MKRSFLAIALLLSVVMLAVFMSERSPAVEQAKNDEFAEPQQIAHEMMEKLKKNDLDGMGELYKAHAGNDSKDQYLAVLTMKAALENSGKNLSECELVGRETVGSSLVRFVYLEKREKTPVVWNLIFYKPKDRWLSKGLSYNQTPHVIFSTAQNLDHDTKVRR